MFTEEYTAVANAAKAKYELLQRNPIGYFASSMLAGIYVGLGIMLIFSIGGQLSGMPYAKLVMGLTFGVALSLVIMAGAELFTGNNLVMAAGIFRGTVTVGQTLKLWAVCYIGNWVGSILLAIAFYCTGLATGTTGEVIAATAATKMSLPLVPMLMRGFICNALVCIAVWCSFRLKSDSGKLIMIFWCLLSFITSGYEHSIANMSLLTVSLLAPLDAAISIGGYFYNILLVTLGNMAGGILCIALPYHLVSRGSLETVRK